MNKLDYYISNANSFEVFKKSILSFTRAMSKSIYNIHNSLGIKFLTRLRIGFSQLKEHKFRHNFQNSINPMCSCSNDIETTIHFFLHFANFTTQRKTLFDKITTINANILAENKDSIINALLFGKHKQSKFL